MPACLAAPQYAIGLPWLAFSAAPTCYTPMSSNSDMPALAATPALSRPSATPCAWAFASCGQHEPLTAHPQTSRQAATQHLFQVAQPQPLPAELRERVHLLRLPALLPLHAQHAGWRERAGDATRRPSWPVAAFLAAQSLLPAQCRQLRGWRPHGGDGHAGPAPGRPTWHANRPCAHALVRARTHTHTHTHVITGRIGSRARAAMGCLATGALQRARGSWTL
jgi:hypothetical protein